MGAQAARLRAAGNERRPKLDYDRSSVGWNLTALPSCLSLELRLLLIFVLFSASFHDVLRCAHEESSGSKTNQMEESWRDFDHFRVARPQPRTPQRAAIHHRLHSTSSCRHRPCHRAVSILLHVVIAQALAIAASITSQRPHCFYATILRPY